MEILKERRMLRRRYCEGSGEETYARNMSAYREYGTDCGLLDGGSTIRRNVGTLLRIHNETKI
jgi:hypothetical protein